MGFNSAFKGLTQIRNIMVLTNTIVMPQTKYRLIKTKSLPLISFIKKSITVTQWWKDIEERLDTTGSKLVHASQFQKREKN